MTAPAGLLTPLGLVLVIAGAVSGRSAESGYVDDDRPTAVAVASQPHCPKNAAELPVGDGLGQFAGAGRVPTSFRPVQTMHCTYVDETTTLTRVVVTESRAPAVTAALLTSLELPDQDFPPFSLEACPALGAQPEYLILIDADGRAVRPRVPESPCGDPRKEVEQAINGLGLAVYATYRFQAPDQ